ncbi:MAG TPA: methionyl-tRNA formyltransferase [Phycisphaerae bacterium]|nr:methionyl-tRNA formyltransferase [Phycisphaerae bacterium]
MRIAFFGSGAFGLPLLTALCSHGHDLCAVVTQPDRPGGRGRRAMPTPIKQEALQRNLPIVQPTDVNAWDSVARLLGLQPDLGVVVAFGQKIGRELLTRMDHRLINVHASLLPKYRGAAPINWAIINGERETGVTVFRLAEQMDAGAILTQQALPIRPGQTAADLHDLLAELAPNVTLPVIEMFAHGQQPPGRQQDHAHATRAPKLEKSDGWIRFDQPADVVANRICGLWPWPGVTCRFSSRDQERDERVTLARALPDRDGGDPAAEPGTVLEDLAIACLPGRVQLLQLRPAGSRLMPFQPDFVNGRRVAPGDRFVPVE